MENIEKSGFYKIIREEGYMKERMEWHKDEYPEALKWLCTWYIFHEYRKSEDQYEYPSYICHEGEYAS